MIILARLLRVSLAAAFCIVVFAALFEFLNTIPSYVFVPHYVENVEEYRRNAPVFTAFLWGLIFRAPHLLFFGFIPLLLVSIALEWFAIRRLWVYLAIWIVAALASVSIYRVLVGQLLPASLAGGAVGYLYWWLAGRTAGIWTATLKSAGRKPAFRWLNVFAYGVLAFLCFQLAGYFYYGGKLFWVSYVSEPGRGVPPFQVGTKRGLSASQKVAMMDFPDPASCLEKGAEPLTSENLRRMDWDRINNTADAEVCIFRLLGSYDDIGYAAAWLEAQGFTVSKSMSNSGPLRNKNGTLSLNSYYLIRDNGPKFPTRGIIRRLYGSIPYSMTVNTIWSEDGKRLLLIGIGFNTL